MTEDNGVIIVIDYNIEGEWSSLAVMFCDSDVDSYLQAIPEADKLRIVKYNVESREEYEKAKLEWRDKYKAEKVDGKEN